MVVNVYEICLHTLCLCSQSIGINGDEGPQSGPVNTTCGQETGFIGRT